MEDTFIEALLTQHTLPLEVSGSVINQVQEYKAIGATRDILTMIHKSILVTGCDTLVTIKFDENAENYIRLEHDVNKPVTLIVGKYLLTLVTNYSTSKKLGFAFNKNVDLIYRLIICCGDRRGDMYRESINKIDKTPFATSLDEPVSFLIKSYMVGMEEYNEMQSVS